MLQAAYQTTFLFKTSNIFWTLAAKLAYIFIPTPGKVPTWTQPTYSRHDLSYCSDLNGACPSIRCRR